MADPERPMNWNAVGGYLIDAGRTHHDKALKAKEARDLGDVVAARYMLLSIIFETLGRAIRFGATGKDS